MNDPSTGTIIFRCSSWGDFTQSLREVIGSSRQHVFRGHSNPTWKLASHFERWLDEQHVQGLNKQALLNVAKLQLAEFKRLSAGVVGNEARDFEEDDWWALGRHNGLATPLLDWSRSPYIAAFFALHERTALPNADVRQSSEPASSEAGHPAANVQVVTVWGLVAEELEGEPEFEIVEPLAFSNERQRAQRGVFTRLTHDRHRDIESYLAERGLAESNLYRWEVPASEAPTAIVDLQHMNITVGSLFPDLMGAATETNETGLWGRVLPPGRRPRTSSASPPFTAYGGGLAHRDRVTAVLGGNPCIATEADANGDWLMAIGDDAPCHPREGDEIAFQVNGILSAKTVKWRAGGAPPDIARGISLRSG